MKLHAHLKKGHCENYSEMRVWMEEVPSEAHLDVFSDFNSIE